MPEDGDALSKLSTAPWTAPGPHWDLEAHAIVSADGRIADADGAMPSGLINGADQSRFQGALDRAAVSVLGREGHEAHPRFGERRRIVLTSRVSGVVEAEPSVWFWNPEDAPFRQALAASAPEGGLVVVTGGTHVFAQLAGELHRFDLTVAHECALPDGRPCLPDCTDLASLMDALKRAGLTLRTASWLDTIDRVELRRFSR